MDAAREDTPERSSPPPSSGPAEACRALEPGTLLASRFRIEWKLGQGGMGQVFAALDTQRSARVALKILGRRTPRSISEIKREFRAAADLVHPNLVRLRELHCDGLDWFFSMDLVDGQTLDELLRYAQSRSPRVLTHIFAQLARALLELHRFGMVHRDLKPSNFLVVGPERHVVLLDFGLAQPFGPDADGDIVGTPAYMAPEQLLGHAVSEAADWYAFGVVLHEALTGRLPPRKPDPGALADVPVFLRELCQDLLERDPGRRPSGKDVLQRIGGRPDSALHALARPAAAGALIGRSKEIETLLEAFAAARAGRASLALIEGPSGIGKSALVERFLTLVQREGALVLSGRCRERESMSYKAIDGLLDDLVGLLDSLSGPAPLLLPEHIAELTVVFPALRAAKAIAQAQPPAIDTVDAAVVRRRAIAAFRELLSRLRSRAPVVVWIDDLQWSDAESALILGPLLGGSRPVPILLVGSHRDGPERGALLDALFSDRMLALPRVRCVSVGPLPPDHAARLALELLPPDLTDPQGLARSIGNDAGGHPLFIAELATWASQRDGSSSARRRTLNELLASRIASMPESARALLEVAAVAGVPRARAVLREATALEPAQAEEALDLLRACRLARSGGLTESDSVDLHHDRIREVVIHELSGERRVRHHRQLAAALARRADTAPQVLATHYEAAGEGSQAGRYLVLAAEQAMQTLAFERAAELYEKALHHTTAEHGQRQTVRIRRAEALAQAGKGPAAADAYLSAAAESEVDATELRRLAAEQLMISGHLDRGLAVIEGVLQASGMRIPRGHRLALLRIALGRLALRLRGLRHVVRSEREIPRELLAKIDAAGTIASSLGPVDFVRGAEFHILHLRAALKAGEPRRLLRALTLEMPYAATPGRGSKRRSARLLAEVERLAHGTEDLFALGLLELCSGLADYLQGDLSSALAKFESALEIHGQRCSGVVWETATAQRFILASLFFLGRLRRLSQLVPVLLKEAEGKGNAYATVCFRAGYGTTAFLVTDEIAEAHRQLERAAEEWNVTGFHVPHTHLLIASSFCDFYEGDVERPLAAIRAMWPRMAEGAILRIAVLRVQLLQLRASAALASAQVEQCRGRSSAAAELRRAARRDTRRLARERIPRARLFATLIHAGLDCADGDRARAERRLRLAIEQAGAQELQAIRSAARVRLGELTGDASELTRGLDSLRAEGVVRPERMVDALLPGSFS